MNPSKRRSGSSPLARWSSMWLSSAIMSFIRCMSSGVIVPIGAGHLVDVALHQLLAQLVHQLLELLLRLARLEVVLLEAPSPCPARSFGSMSSWRWRSPVAASRGLRRRSSPDCAGLVELAVELLALGVDDLAQLAGDVVVDAAEVVLLELVAPPAAQLLEHVAQALELLAVAVAEPLLHQPAQGGVEVAVVEQVVGDLARTPSRRRCRSRPGCRPSGSR